MLKWKLSTLIAVVFGFTGIAWGQAQRTAPTGFFELRVYKAQPGKRDELAARFANRTAAIYARHGITNVGYWIPQQSVPAMDIDAQDTFLYIRGYPSREERDKRVKARGDDPEFNEVVTRAERNPETRLIDRVYNVDMIPHGPYTAITIRP
jgi:hypothetical protein